MWSSHRLLMTGLVKVDLITHYNSLDWKKDLKDRWKFGVPILRRIMSSPSTQNWKTYVTVIIEIRIKSYLSTSCCTDGTYWRPVWIVIFKVHFIHECTVSIGGSTGSHNDKSHNIHPLLVDSAKDCIRVIAR
jgi:hypothetical protein